LSSGQEAFVLEALAALIEQSLVHVQETNGEPRYTMLETIREYALERLAEHGETAPIQQRHAEYFVAFAEEAMPALAMPPEEIWIAILDREVENLRSVLRWATTNENEIELGLRLMSTTYQYWEIRAGRAEGHQWLEQLWVKADNAAPALRLKASIALAELRNFYDCLNARALLQTTAPLITQVRDLQLQLWHILISGMVEHFIEDRTATLAAWETGLALAVEHSDTRWIAEFRSVLGMVARDLEQWNRSEMEFRESLRLSRELNYPYLIAENLFWLTLLAMDRGNLSQARVFVYECADIARRIGHRRTLALALESMSDLLIEQQNLAEAEKIIIEAIELAQVQGNPRAVARSYYRLGWMRFNAGQLDTAETLLRKGVVAAEQHPKGSWGEFSLLLGRIQAIRGNDRQAEQLYCESLTKFCLYGWTYGIAVVFESIAALKRQNRSIEQTARLWGAAEMIRETATLPTQLVERFEPSHTGIKIYRDQLGSAEWESAWAAGRALTWQQAADEALAWLNEAQGATP